MPAVYVFMCTMQKMFVHVSRMRRSCIGLSWGSTGTNAVGHDVWLQSKACGPKISIAYLDCLRYFAKDRVYSLPCESNGGVDGCWLPTHITHSISSSHLELESLSRRVMVLQRMQCNWALIMCRPASQLYVGLVTFDVDTRRTCSAGWL